VVVDPETEANVRDWLLHLDCILAGEFAYDVAVPDVTVLVAGAAQWVVRSMQAILKRAGAPVDIPQGLLVAVCTSGTRRDVVDVFRAGATDCFFYPEDCREVERLLAAPIGIKRAPLAPRLRAHALAGTTSRLTPTQLAVLACLLRHRGEWVAARELGAQALGAHHVGASTTIRVHIHAIRKALGDNVCIESDPTHRKGYRVASPATNVGRPDLMA
jgi:hypothetical protein